MQALRRFGFSQDRDDGFFRYMNLLLPQRPATASVLNMGFKRGFFAFILFWPVIVDAVRYDAATNSIRAPNDGDHVWWITKFESLVATLVLVTELVGVVAAIKSRFDVEHDPSAVAPALVRAFWIMRTLDTPAAYTVMAVYWSRVRPHATYVDSNGAVVVIAFLAVTFDFLFGRVPFFVAHSVWALISAAAYFSFLSVYDVATGKTTYKAIPWIEDPRSAVGASVAFVFTNLAFAIAFSALRYVRDKLWCVKETYFREQGTQISQTLPDFGSA